MAVDTTINLLQTLNASIQGVVSSPQMSAYPTVIDTAACPYVITWPTQGDWYMKGGGWKVQTRTYAVLCYVVPIAQDDIPSNLTLSAPLFQRFIDAYVSAANIAQANVPTYQVTIASREDGTHHTDDGIRSDLRMSGKTWHGFILHVRVREQWL